MTRCIPPKIRNGSSASSLLGINDHRNRISICIIKGVENVDEEAKWSLEKLEEKEEEDKLNGLVKIDWRFIDERVGTATEQFVR